MSQRSKGSSEFLSGHPGNELVKPPKLPDSFLYFGSTRFLGHFDVLLKQFGIRIEQTHGVPCPCVELSKYGGEGKAQPSCAACHGRRIAFVYADTKSHIGLVTGVTARKERMQEGSHVSGEVQVTVPSGVVLDDGDLLVFPDVLTPIKAMRLFDKQLGGIVLPFLVSEVETMVTKGPRPEDHLVALVAGKDFTLDAKRRFLTFPKGSCITHGMPVSGTFLGAADYIVSGALHNARGRLSGLAPGSPHIQFPRSYSAIRADILYGQDLPEVTYSGNPEEIKL